MLKEVTSSSEDEDEEDISKLIFFNFYPYPIFSLFLSVPPSLSLSPFLQLLKLQMMVGVVIGCCFYCDISFRDV